MITLLLTLTAYASEPCVDAITDDPHEWLTWEANSTGIVIRQTDGPVAAPIAAHCGWVSLRTSSVPEWGDMTPGHMYAVGGGTGAGMGAVVASDGAISIPDTIPAGLYYVHGEALKVRIND